MALIIISCFLTLFRSAELIEWVCAKDDTAMLISEEGRLKCSDLIPHNDLIINWKFDCGDRVGPHRNTHFLSADYEGFNFAISMAMLHSSWSTADWATKLIQNLKKQYGKS